MKTEELEALFDLNIAYTHSAGELADVVNDLAREVLALRQRVEAAKKMAEMLDYLLTAWVLVDEQCEDGDGFTELAHTQMAVAAEHTKAALAAFRATGGEG